MLKPCPSWNERLSAYLDNEANDETHFDVKEHLATCPACRAAVELYRCDAQDIKTALQARTAGDDFAAKVMAQVEVTKMEGEAKETPIERKHVPSFWSQFLPWATVVCLIAVVGSVLFPVFAKARCKSYQTTCLNNIRQLVVGVQMYAEENGGYLPSVANWKTSVGTVDKKIFQCPTSGKDSYVYNAALSGKKVGDIASPETTPIIWCTADHTKSRIVGYVDGHVGMVRVPDLSETVPFGLQSPAAAPATRSLVEGMRVTLSAAPSVQNAKGEVNWDTDKRINKTPTITPPTKNYGLADKLQIAYVADMALHSKDVQGAMERAEWLFNKFDGFVLNSTYQRGEKETAEATVSGRVPAAKLGVLLVELDKLGVLQSRTVNGEDLTAQHLEQLEQLGDLEGTQARLGEIETRAKPNEALRAEEKLHGAAREASGVTVDEYRLKSKVTLAEVTVQIATPPPAEQKPEPVSQSVSRATYALRAFGLWLLTGLLIPLAIWLPVWGAVLGLVYLAHRRLRRLEK